MGSANAFAARRARVAQWYAPARFGLFYHWGTYTGGGSSEIGDFNAPFAHETIEDFEAATGTPESVGKNLVALAKTAGAKYITWTLMHSCDRFVVKFPTKNPGFTHRTTQDYAGALLDAATAENIKVLFYIPTGGYRDGMDMSWFGDAITDQGSYTDCLCRLAGEVLERYGDKLAGFWLDGWTSLDLNLPAYIRGALPQAIIVQNGLTSLSMDELDYVSSEFLRNTPEPDYNRPSGLLKCDRFGALPPRDDFVEDIPTCNQWWHKSPYLTDEQLQNSRYVKDPTCMVKEMISSIGQRGMWNYAQGLGPCIDGTAPELFKPMLQKTGEFLAWAGEAVYNTVGGRHSALCPGWCWKDAFASVTVSLEDPRIHYLHVTTPSNADMLILNTNGPDVLEVKDLRTGRKHPFLDRGCLEIYDIDWTDVEMYGAKVFKITIDV